MEFASSNSSGSYGGTGCCNVVSIMSTGGALGSSVGGTKLGSLGKMLVLGSVGRFDILRVIGRCCSGGVDAM